MTTQQFAMAKIVLDILKSNAETGTDILTAGQIARSCNISRNSAVKYLKTLIEHGEVTSTHIVGKNQQWWTYYRLTTEIEKTMGGIPF